jgi:hypothetical protein
VPTAGVTGKRGVWREKPPDAESAVWGRFLESAGKAPHLSGARGVGQVLQDGFELGVPFHCIYRWARANLFLIFAIINI